ncbi:S-adenosyl-L-methionine-dependent methyltransferase [Flagelloscypha sp. PMI_526]|nr:S-adenosyl-L-methionine-dependent methyltransferase [Flagelloscypha sp. PMI_526]
MSGFYVDLVYRQPKNVSPTKEIPSLKKKRRVDNASKNSAPSGSSMARHSDDMEVEIAREASPPSLTSLSTPDLSTRPSNKPPNPRSQIELRSSEPPVSHSEDENSDGEDIEVLPIECDDEVLEFLAEADDLEPSVDNSAMDDEENIPIRILENFKILDATSHASVPFASLLRGGTEQDVFAVGRVSSARPGDLESQDNDPLPIKTTPLLNVDEADDNAKVDLYFFDEAEKTCDSHVWIRTEFAWYILKQPHKSYAPFFNKFSKHHDIFNQLLSFVLDAIAEEQSLPTLSTFSEFIDEGEDWLDDDLASYLAQNIPLVWNAIAFSVPRFRDAPIFSSPLLSERFNFLEPDEDLPVLEPERPTRRRRVQAKHTRKAKNARRVTVTLAPIISSIVGTAFELGVGARKGDVTHFRDEDHQQQVGAAVWEKENALFAHDPSIKTKGLIATIGRKEYFKKAKIVHRGEGEKHTIKLEVGYFATFLPDRANHTQYYGNTLKFASPTTVFNTSWIGKIVSIFRSKGSKISQCHVHWYEPTCRTIQGEFGDALEVVQLTSCDDVDLMSITGLVTIEMIPPDTLPHHTEKSSSNSRNFFCAYAYDKDINNMSFSSLPTTAQVQETLSYLDKDTRKVQPCTACGLQIKQDYECTPIFRSETGSTFVFEDGYYFERELPEVIQVKFKDFLDKNEQVTSLLLHGHVYHPKDFVFLPSSVAHHVQKVARIESIDVHKGAIEFCCYESARGDPLTLTRREDGFDIGCHEIHKLIRGPCSVRHRSKAPPNWGKSGRLEFFIDRFSVCSRCVENQEKQTRYLEDLRDQAGKLRGWDAFCGSGGMSRGAEESGGYKTVMAIDYDEAAARTFKANHPGALVLHDDVSKLVEVLVEFKNSVRDTHRAIDPLLNQLREIKLNGRSLKDGFADHFHVLQGGPPCQPFSILNRLKNEVIVSDPRAKLSFAMLSIAELLQPDYIVLENVAGLLRRPLGLGGNKEDEVKHGIFKLLVTCFTGIGYQVRPTFLQAASYGSPQARLRLVFLAAKRTLPLPKAPLPTHAYELSRMRGNLDNVSIMVPSLGCPKEEVRDWSAPFPTVTAGDAVHDLSDLDLSPGRDPRFLEPITDTYTLDIDDLKLSHYAREMRQGSPNDARVAYHRTFWKSSKVLSNHRTVNPKDKFGTLTTNPNPFRGSRSVHWQQNRLFTTREVARVQGLPDSYKFVTTKLNERGKMNEIYRMIGNGVPMQLSRAIMRSVLDSRLANLLAEEDNWQHSPSRENSPDA